jgi:cysteine-rich repeat protein
MGGSGGSSAAGAGGGAGTGSAAGSGGSSAAGAGGSAGTGGTAGSGGSGTATCGNGMLDLNLDEQCDASASYGGPNCSATCKLPSCGDGVWDPGEGCDDGNLDDTDGCHHNCYGSGGCDTLGGVTTPRTCVGFKQWERNAQCDTYRETFAKVGCCTEPNAADPTCPRAYPFSLSFPLPSQGDDLDWPERVIAPLAMTSCRPVVLTVEAAATPNSRFFGGGASLTLNFAELDTLWRVGAGGGPRDGARNPVLIQVDRPLTTVTAGYSVDVCTTSTCTDTISSGTIAFHFAEYLPDTLAAPANPVDSPRVSGDQTRVVVTYREAVSGVARVALIGGQVGTGIGRYALAEPAYQPAFGPSYLSTAGRQASPPDLVHLEDDGTMPGNTLVAWVEDGTDLQLAVVNDAGATLGSGVVHTGAGLADVRIVSISPQNAAIAFVETIGADRRLRLLPVSATGSAGSVVDISPPGANASEPTLSTLPELVWVQDTAGDSEIWGQDFTQDTFTLSGAARAVTTGAVAPRTPALLYINSINFADTVNGQQRLYWVRDNSPPAAPQRLTTTPSERPVVMKSMLGSRPNLLGWHEPGRLDAVRLNRIPNDVAPALGTPGSVSLGCATRGADSLALAWLGNYPSQIGARTPVSAPQIFGVWLENGTIVGKQIPGGLYRSPRTCPAGQNYCDSELELRQCDANGQTSRLVKQCTFPEVCDPARLDCACRPGRTCNGNAAVTCQADGTYAGDAQDCTALGQTCVDGTCRAPMYSENFESGIVKDWYRMGTALFRIDSSLGANGTSRSLFFSCPRDQGYVFRYFETGIRPQRVSFYWRTPGPASSSINNSRVVIEGTNGSTELRLSGSQLYVNDPGSTTIYTAAVNTWYHVELTNFAWASGGGSYNISVNGSTPRTVTMVTPIGPELRLVRLVGGDRDAYWDEFLIE